jgi:putative hydrolase of the HAD superfamily
MPFEFILFDLDNTLYSRESGLLQQIGRRIQLWLCEHLGVGWEQAALVRRDYFVRYGTTLNGLLIEDDVDAHDYLTFVHDVPVETFLSPDPALAAMLASIPLRRVIYTNATTEYSGRVLHALGVADLFERVISIEDVGLRNKLYREGYEYVLRLLNAAGPQCIMVEDSDRNLIPAKALGMTTVLVGQGDGIGSPDGGVDYAVQSVMDVGWVVSRLLNASESNAQTAKPTAL